MAMPPPLIVGLTICDQIIVDRATEKPSLIGVFTGLGVDEFPSEHRQFSVFAVLTDSLGEARIAVVAVNDETGDEVYGMERSILFPTRAQVVNASFRIRRISFPLPGWYTFYLKVDDEIIAHRRLRVYQSEGEP